MEKKQHPFRKIRLVYLRSSPLLKCVVLSTLIATTIALLVLTIGIRDARMEAAENRTRAEELEFDNNDLQNKTNAIGSVEGDKALAEELLGLVDPDTVVITPTP